MKNLSFPWANMARNGAAARARADPHDIKDPTLNDGGGGSCSGDAAVNGMNDLKLGSMREPDIKCSCWRMANMRKFSVI
jgi:hypothetical protein